MKTKYLQASFRDAVFLVESTSDEQGARNILHEFPGREDAHAEPSGNYAARFSIEAHLIGPHFEAQLVALEAALKQPGAGKLVHPHRGTKFCALDGPYRVNRSTRELGIVRVSMTFVEAGPAQEPRVVPDTSAVVQANALTAASKIGAGAAARFSASGPDFLTTAARAVLSGPRGVISVLSKVNNRIHATFGLIDDVSRTFVTFGNQVGTLLQSPDTLMLHLHNLVNSVVASASAAGIDLARGDDARNRARVAAIMGYVSALGVFGDSLAAVPTNTSTRQQQADNQAALVDVVEASALISACAALTEIPFDNADQATDNFATLRDLFDRLLDRSTIDDASNRALRDLRAAFHAHLRRTVGNLPELGRYTPPVTAPALVLAYRLYGDSTRDQEIVERNPSIEHPGFVLGGVELQVAEV